MDEKFIEYVWFNRLFLPEQKTLFGQKVEVVSTGYRNANSGPDVFNAKIKIDNILWAGNVEFHVKASDWHLHSHDDDPAYEKIVLHVVLNADEQIYLNEMPLPTIVLDYPQFIAQRYSKIYHSTAICEADFSATPTLKKDMWLERLVVERENRKSEEINALYAKYNGDKNMVFYVVLARAFGFAVNADAMQMLAESVPLLTLFHFRNDIVQLEAVLLGQAGLLDERLIEKYFNDSPVDEYVQLLVREYDFLKKKYSLAPVAAGTFKFMRMRPQNFPTLRIAQFAHLLHCNDHLLSTLLECKSLDDMRALLSCAASDYWRTHYRPGAATSRHSAKLPKSSIDLLILNTIIPYLFSYAKWINRDEIAESALELLRAMPAEKNHIISQFAAKRLTCENAFHSQALIQLYKEYCCGKRCFQCQFAHCSIITNYE